MKYLIYYDDTRKIKGKLCLRPLNPKHYKYLAWERWKGTKYQKKFVDEVLSRVGDINEDDIFDYINYCDRQPINNYDVDLINDIYYCMGYMEMDAKERKDKTMKVIIGRMKKNINVIYKSRGKRK